MASDSVHLPPLVKVSPERLDGKLYGKKRKRKK
jgi:hypothetical protein